MQTQNRKVSKEKEQQKERKKTYSTLLQIPYVQSLTVSKILM